ncbi:hypothetical protein G9C85_06850 [Halorubellus sp. JP-L1]|uniref:hypothetical protein n=1 Tax=Halorubellus sp. JP-L1 TaxID=2715753 RepID=UPI00140B56A1|nr:hypothetical protein [Halorubellus sp. JP-L1]NHN41355.1 hypothetical protein [Halorubellus sp. JP-L1]
MPFPLPDSHALPGSRRVTRSVLKPVRVLGFWTAVALPFLHIPLLLTGLDGASDTFAFLALFVLNVLALLVGHPHGEA